MMLNVDWAKSPTRKMHDFTKCYPCPPPSPPQSPCPHMTRIQASPRDVELLVGTSGVVVRFLQHQSINKLSFAV